MTTINYDTATRAMTIDASTAHSWGADVQAVLNRHGQTISLAGVTFGVSVTINGAAPVEHQWPAPGVAYVSTDQDLLASYRVKWSPDDEVTISAWLESPLGRVEASESFIAPRPAQPFASWTWVDGAWTPPIPYPDDGGEYKWDESAEEWASTS